ncbi:Retinal multi-domain protein [Pyrenophora tritici-repentis]|nr:Retinal multi-domain protein [Pyrenophora tritici-repentis]
MPKKKRPKRGVPVLVYAEPSEIDKPWLLGSLTINQSSTDNQISLLVATSVSLPGSDQKHNFVLGYDADNLVSGTTALATNAGSCNTAWLEKIARDGVPRMHTLSLTLKSACSIWYMRQALPTTCRQLVEIAKAHKVHLIIDFSWLQEKYHSCIRRLVSNSTGLYGSPVSATLAKFERGDWTIFQPLGATNEPLNELPAYVKTSTKRPRPTIKTSSSPPSKRPILGWKASGFPPQSPTKVATSPSRGITSPPSKHDILESEASGFPPQSPTKVATSPSRGITSPPSKHDILESEASGFPPQSPTKVATSPSRGITSPPSKHDILESEAFGFPPQSPTEVATSPSCGITSPPSKHDILESEASGFPPQSPAEVATSPSCDTTIDESTAFSDRQFAAISGAVAQQIPSAFAASPRRFFPHPGISPLVSDASESSSTSSSQTRFPQSLSNKHIQDVLDHLKEAQWNITVATDESIGALDDIRDALLREVKDELATQTVDFEEYLDTIVGDIIGKADEKAAAIISKADEKAAAMMSKADEKMRDAAAMMSTVERMAKAATASLWDVATKASGDRDANSRRPFARGKGGYRGLGTRSFLH